MQAPVWPKKIILPEHIELNVGGKHFSTTKRTLCRERHSLLATLFSGRVQLQKDSKGRYFIDRDGILFAHILDFIRRGLLLLPEGFDEYQRLLEEAKFYNLVNLVKAVENQKLSNLLQQESCKYSPVNKKLERINSSCPNLSEKNNCDERQVPLSLGTENPTERRGHFLTINVQATFGASRREQSDSISFHKTPRLLISGHAGIVKSVFQSTLNMSRDIDPENDRYTSRFYLTHNNIHKAFEQLYSGGFRLVSSCAGKTGHDKTSEEGKWNHFIVYVFFRSSK